MLFQFLGNFKEKSVLGIRVRRERAPFVFTPQMAHVMRNEGNRALFENKCCLAYNILRKHAARFLSLYMLVCCTADVALPRL